MIRIGISVALEKRLRAGTAGVTDILALIDTERTRGRGQKGMSYDTIVNTLRGVLGSRLVLPPSPSDTWIARIVRRVKELGYDQETLSTLGIAAGKRPGPVNFEWLIWRGVGLLQARDGHDEVPRGNAKVLTGRTEEE